MAITISVKLFASLAAYKPAEFDSPTCSIVTHDEATIEQLILQLGIPVDKVRTISHNEKLVKSDTILADGDILILYPAIAGG